MNKNEFSIIDKQLKQDFGDDSDQYKILSSFFLSDKLNKYLKLLSILRKSSMEDLDDSTFDGFVSRGRFSLRNF